MNNIDELINIIKRLGGYAESYQILKTYYSDHKMIFDESFLPMIEKTLNDNLDLVFFNDFNKKWSIKDKKDDTSINRIIYFNIAYMKHYKGITKDDVPHNGGKYVDDNGDAYEKYNFSPYDNKYVYGFVETGRSKGRYKEDKQKELHIENIDKSYTNEDSIDGVTIIMCANSPILQKSVIVGWYDNATIYRYASKHDFNGNPRFMISKCKIKDAHLIEETDRTFIVPRASTDGIGIGQTNYWYANKPEHVEFKEKTISYINSMRENLSDKNTKYKPVEDAQVTDSWKKYYSYIDNNYSNININHIEGSRGYNAIWPEIKTKYSFIKILHKTSDGNIDLTLPNLANKENEVYVILKNVLNKDVSLVKTSKSLAIRIKTNPIDFHKDLNTQTYELKDSFDKITQLLNLCETKEFSELVSIYYL